MPSNHIPLESLYTREQNGTKMVAIATTVTGATPSYRYNYTVSDGGYSKKNFFHTQPVIWCQGMITPYFHIA